LLSASFRFAIVPRRVKREIPKQALATSLIDLPGMAPSMPSCAAGVSGML
jgi:hypothetical protein